MSKIDQIDGTTYGFQLGDDYAEIGNKGAAKFEPHIMLPRWNGECKFKLLYPSVGVPSLNISGDGKKLQWRLGDIGLDWYTLPATGQFESALEMEQIWYKRPPSNEFRLPFETNGLSLYHQPKLTQEEIDEGASRPDNVVNSIAIYRTAGGNHEIGKTNYMAGKSHHLFRGFATDDNGWKVWVDKFLGHNEIVYVMPYDFWLNAKYPIRHAAGDTFGQTGIGGTYSEGFDWIQANISTGAAGTADSISVYGWRDQWEPTVNMKCALYKDSDSSLVDGTNEIGVDSHTPQWWVATFASPPVISAIDYGIAYWNDTGFQYYYDSGTNKRQYISYGTWPNPATFSSDTKELSIYCTYTSGEPTGLSIPIAMHHYKQMAGA